ncbi:hypothetical protein [Microvirga aerophila]|uniref:Mechanosensitive ion channel protein MscS n=1 Tax=Microvirga aerophila TaxID=670291 RepID=A0A512C068_9HYPH|nr:hypothetical protein [Microvirga aerophila]GEO17583.1 hypothetical protein MAE02_52790 [Microvirga aerophila]
MLVQRTQVQWLPALARWATSVLGAALLAVLGSLSSASAQDTPPPAQVQELVKLLDDPAVRSWLEQARNGQGAPAASGRVADSAKMASRLSGVREHLRVVATALPRFPAEMRQASGLLLQELKDRGLFAIVALIGVFVALGYGSERLFWRTTKHTRTWIGRHPMATVADRLRMIAMCLGFGLTLVAIFGLGSIGALLLFDWPPLLRQVVIAYLVAVVLFRLSLVLGRVVLVPDGTAELGDPERFRVVPMPAENARFWHRRLALFAGYWAFGHATVDLLGVFGFGPDLQDAAAYILGLGLLGIALEAI